VSDAIPIALDAEGRHVKEVLPIDVALVLYDFPELVAPSVEYQLVRTPSVGPELHVRVELRSERAGDRAALERAVHERLRERLGVRVRLEILDWGTLPRFDYKAARVVNA
jgi:phenylacetate-coenzyme A ligase PaaK-like adenylate-forming protein